MSEAEENLGYSFEAIDNLRNNLEGYRIQHNNGFPILKELIQNANDAEATEMILKYFPGDESADHELLKNNQGIFIYNNGPFTNTNETAMRTIGGSDKKKDTEKVGKYGLGMKSIYHICDFFFYVVDGERVSFLNPWYKQGNPNYIHKEWSVISDKDKEIIKKYSPKPKKGLSILIPGKIDYKDFLKNQEWHIATGNSVKMDFPFGSNREDLIKDLMLCLALLQNVSSKEKHLQTIIYEFSENEKIEIYKTSDSKIVCKDSSGTIIQQADYASYCSSDLVDRTKISLFQILDEKKLIGDKIVGDEKLRKSTFELIKTRLPEAKKGHGKLSVKFCVFLPLQEPAKLECPIYTDFDYTILINAPYMIGHDRQGMFGYKSLTTEVKEETVSEISYKESASKCWNQLLSQNIVFPNLPKLFEDVVEKKLTSDSELQQILTGLRNLSSSDNNVINKYSTTVYGFARRYFFEKDKLTSEWILIDFNDISPNRYVYIPKSSNSASLLAVFPALMENAEDAICIEGDSKENYLLPSNYHPDDLLVTALINSFSVENLRNKIQISIITEFLNDLKDNFKTNNELCSCLISKIKDILLNITLEEIFSVRSALSELFNTINQLTGDTTYKIYAVDATTVQGLKISVSDWRKMWASESDFIIVPRIISIDSDWNEEYKEELLLGTEKNRSKSICQFLIDNKLSGKSQNTVINGIVNVRRYIKKIIENFADICIFGIINIRTQSKVEYKNSVEFRELLRNKQIFQSV